MNVTIIFPDIDEKNPSYRGDYSIAIGYVAACLKRSHHRVSLIHPTKPMTKDQLIGKLKDQSPDLVGFSTISQQYQYVQRWAAWIKEEMGLPLICGGVHPILSPEETIQDPNLDIISIGEGEMAFEELCNRWEAGEAVESTLGFWFKKDGKIIRNPVRPFTVNLDEIPIPDRDIFDYRNLDPFHRKYIHTYLRASRGCIYRCTYCSNDSIRNMYENRKEFVRYHSVDRVIREAKLLVEKFPELDYLMFHDDILPAVKEWFAEFAEKYPKEVGIPFRCKGHLHLIDPEVVEMLKSAGCFRIQFGLESGNDEILRLLKRPSQRGRAEKVFKWCRDAGIQTASFNMVGVPHEDDAKALDTVKLNARVRPDIQLISVFYPFKNTGLYDLSVKEGLLPENRDDLKTIRHDESLLTLPGFSREKIVFYHRYFRTLVLLYSVLYRLPGFLREVSIRVADGIVKSPMLPVRLLTWIHDRFLKDVLLRRAYFRTEDKIMGGPRRDQITAPPPPPQGGPEVRPVRLPRNQLAYYN